MKMVADIVAGQVNWLKKVVTSVPVFVGWLMLTPASLNAALLITFANGDSLDGHVAGSTANFVIDGQDAILTTRGVFPDGSINTTNGALGINAVGSSDRANAFDDGESWVFDWSIDTLFLGIDFELFSTSTEKFTLQNSDWIGLSLTPQDSNITFDGLLGEFRFASDDFTDDFDLTDLSNGTPLSVSAGSALTLTFLGSASDNASLQSLTFASSTSVPEPGTLALVSLAGLTFLVYSGFQRRRQNLADCNDSGALKRFSNC